ncbi:MAG: DNA protecting protein DprA [Chloroflexi bacterium GWB2_49_20]|nr:MAG: DNA protecting protein DprA [Chloroflexi bacterium GWB2_49_20]OGN78436.1 MAG: DNA protecting protein DprA [Chloroflexi bacterium GWC2_49_37]OGN84101.1 MAG: DNA protecting protein DprA [Chloroflexi bacterium GWD2_49_16]HBG75251.1 DNA-protecting protein DprA [Anaerolineae bacterium]HCC79114.1 DNA-protecting protein DprA [Anaerolineae bacterium]
MNEKLYWVGFNLVKGIGAVRLRALNEHFGDLAQAWEATPSQLRDTGLSSKIVENIVQMRSSVNLENYYEKILSKGIVVITSQEDNYPNRLKEIDQPPPVIYVRGDLIADDFWAVAIVGTRRVTAYGRQVTDELASYLAQNGVTVISGMARGVDAIAHQAAIKAGGRTIAVLGSGVDRIYPPEHRSLSDQIINQGAVISDYAPGTPPDSSNFPPRNRIISGLSMAVVVIEAAETSGALITASFAGDQGRDVFAVPGNILAPQSKGTNRLIQQGAHPLLSGRDLLDTLNLTRVNEQRVVRHAIPVDATEAKVLDVLGREPLHVDEIRSQTGLAIESVSAALVMMELKGMVQQVGGMNYVAVREEQSEYLVNKL